MAELELLGTGDVARHAGVSVGLIKKLDRLGLLPPSVRLGSSGRRVWSIDQLDVIEVCITARRNGRRREVSGVAA
ncbi:MAG: MerR family transcriptional regulator [Thermomicrobiales bacterium]